MFISHSPIYLQTRKPAWIIMQAARMDAFRAPLEPSAPALSATNSPTIQRPVKTLMNVTLLDFVANTATMKGDHSGVTVMMATS